MSRWSRLSAGICVLVTTAFQVAAEWNAVPSPMATAPWLDGRPTTVLVTSAPEWRPGRDDPQRFVCFDDGRGPRYGILEGGSVLELRGDLFAPVATTGLTHRLSEVALLSPLGPDLPGRVLRLDDPPAPQAEARLTPLGSQRIAAPEGTCFRWSGDHAEAEAVVGLVVGESGRSVFGLTAGVVLRDARSITGLVLGPTVMRGITLPGRNPTLELADSVGQMADQRPVTSRLLRRAEARIASAGLSRGDLVVLGRPSSVVLGVPPGERELRCHLTGVGESRCLTQQLSAS